MQIGKDVRIGNTSRTHWLYGQTNVPFIMHRGILWRIVMRLSQS